jgi:hypothetical protein
MPMGLALALSLWMLRRQRLCFGTSARRRAKLA